ncbi:MAG: hypothetical protein IJN86_06665 [Clostridia bacterium]|nr:hypothetical protein [Clostridia bacterium]
MRKKLFNILNNIYGVAMSISFFAGILPLIPFIYAVIVGGTTGEKISVFIKDEYYPWVIILGSVAIVVGLVAMYLGKLEALSLKNISTDEEKNK